MAHSAKFTESEPIWFCSLFYRVLHSVKLTESLFYRVLHSVKYVHIIFFVCFSAYPVTISNKITGNYNNMTDRQYISHICPQMSHPLTITNICRQAPCKVHKHHQHMSKVHKVQPSPQFNIQTHQTRSDGLSHGRRPAEKRSQVQVLITLHIVVRSSCRRSLE